MVPAESRTAAEKLPIGLQAFEVLRTQGYLYVDKTRYIYRMATQGMFYFLARPRRFGKSLLVTTLKCLFQGRQELFAGLWIAEHGQWEWQPHPVIVMSFNELPVSTPADLKQGLAFGLKQIAKSYGVVLESQALETQFQELVLGLFQATGRPVVVLIDEYDKPISEHLGKGADGLEIAKANREVLRSFLGALKGITIAPVLRFVFLTGISKFSKVSIFSELNNLDDITMHEGYVEMLGYTQTELEIYFPRYLAQLAEKFGWSQEHLSMKLARQYNGYRFSKKDTRVYNPFSILKAFSALDFQDYWFESGTPAFLINLLQQARYDLSKIEGLEVTETIFTTYDLERLKPEALLFQTGYLTIKAFQDGLYLLGYPNPEVKHAFVEALLFAYVEKSPGEEFSSQVFRLAGYLAKEDLAAFFETLTAIFASIPYTLNAQRDEAYFHTIFYLLVSASGTAAASEVLTSRGRIDLVVRLADKVYVIEFKCNQSAAAALEQIRARGYAEKYRQRGQKILLIGINFSTATRNLAEWQVDVAE